MPPKQRIGQGILDIGDVPVNQPEQVPDALDLDKRIAASRLIKLAMNISPPDPSEVTERDLRVMSPSRIVSGLYMPEGSKPADIPNSYKGVIFPADQFLLIARSSRDLALHTRSKSSKTHMQDDNKQSAGAAANRSAGHMLKNYVASLTTLEAAVADEEKRIGIYSGELHGANDTGFFAHFNGVNLQPIAASVETSIFDALNVAATTHKWDKEKLVRARKTVLYQLYGIDSSRVKNWIGYTDMAKDYAHARRIIIGQAGRMAAIELAKYQPFLDAEEN